jgi:hypothetical protein
MFDWNIPAVGGQSLLKCSEKRDVGFDAADTVTNQILFKMG